MDPDRLKVPERVWLAGADEASQLDEGPVLRLSPASTSDIEYVRADVAAANAGVREPPPGAAAATGRAVVARWCEEWGDERPSRAMLERMAQDIDLAVAVAVEARLAEDAAIAEARARAVRDAKAAAGRPAAAAVAEARLPQPMSARIDVDAARKPFRPDPSVPHRGTGTASEASASPGAVPGEPTTVDPGAASAPRRSGRSRRGGARAAEAGGPQLALLLEPDAVALPAPPSSGDADADWSRVDAHLVRPWSSADVDVIAGLAARPEGLAVWLWPEPGNAVDVEAVAVVVGLAARDVGGLPAPWDTALRIVGYVARADAGKRALFDLLRHGGPLGARLRIDADGLVVHVPRGCAPSAR